MLYAGRMQANWPSRLRRETPSRSVRRKPSPLAVASEDGRTASPGPSPAGTNASRNSPSRLKTRIHGGDSSRIRTCSPRMTASRGLRRSDNQPACSTSPNVEITPTSSQVRAACVSIRPSSEVQDAVPRRPATITNRGDEERYFKSAFSPGEALEAGTGPGGSSSSPVALLLRSSPNPNSHCRRTCNGSVRKS